MKKNRHTRKQVSALDLQAVADAYLSALIVLNASEGIPDEARPYVDDAISLIAQTLPTLANQYEAKTKKKLDLSHVEHAFHLTPTETSNDTKEI